MTSVAALEAGLEHVVELGCTRGTAERTAFRQFLLTGVIGLLLSSTDC